LPAGRSAADDPDESAEGSQEEALLGEALREEELLGEALREEELLGEARRARREAGGRGSLRP
jgi:hypothetical protein